MTTVMIDTTASDHELTRRQTIDFLRAKYRTPEAAFLHYIRAKALKPDLTMSEFRKLFAQASSDGQLFVEEVEFRPTHFDVACQKRVMVKAGKNGTWDITWENGTCGNERELPGRFVPLYYR